MYLNYFLFLISISFDFPITDKDYITYSEWTNEFGGAKARNSGENDFKQLPFYCCNLSLRPIEGAAVCTVQGEIFDFMQIIPYLRRHNNVHPFLGTELKPSDLIRITFHKNESGEYFCPITRKTLNENSKIVVNRRTGNVFAWETVEILNIQKGNWKDLITEEEFTREDLIILQDPQNPKDYSKIYKRFEEAKLEDGKSNLASRVNLSGGVGKVLKDLKMTEIKSIGEGEEDDSIREVSQLNSLAAHTTGKASGSLTSTSISIKTENELAILDEAETLSKYFPVGKETTGTVCIRTNYGDLFFTLFASKSPKCSYNFIELAKKGYYDNLKFHRFVKGFILQGGDPSGLGNGGESCWNRPFAERLLHPSLKHDARGILSMANAGDVNSNGSQFFITLRPAPHLNGKHAIFGKLLSGSAVLDKIEAEVEVDAASNHCPLEPIIMEHVLVLEDPFEEAKKELLKAKDSVKRSSIGNIKSKMSTTSTSPSTATKAPPQIGKYLVMKNKK